MSLSPRLTGHTPIHTPTQLSALGSSDCETAGTGLKKAIRLQQALSIYVYVLLCLGVQAREGREIKAVTEYTYCV